MIGVAARPADRESVEEFFELFKTPWEWFVPGRYYSAVLIADGRTEPGGAAAALVFGSAEHQMDRDSSVCTRRFSGPTRVQWGEWTLPVSSGVATFHGPVARGVLTIQADAVDYRTFTGGKRRCRVGYDLFAEIGFLLRIGQPTEDAQTPTLELHISLLRQLLLDSEVSFVEIPPRPFGREFACCLTHDVDFSGVTRHKFDRTLAGFLVRASVGTFVGWLRGHRSLADVEQNWRAVCSLPFVFLGLLPDFWRPFEEYLRADRGLPSTFFVIPFKGRPGSGPDGQVSAKRAAPYQASEIGPDISEAAAAGSELAVHGIDAWQDADTGRAELAELARVSGQKTAGVRMHWLYFDAESPRQLEAAGFDYDSTCGYNDAVGYRAGTSQVFRLPGTERLMELPLSIMDSALLSPGRMGLGPTAAVARGLEIVKLARKFGGTVVVNWHCRSLSPERLWIRPYEQLLDELTPDGRAWIATAADVVNWFRWRRSIRFSSDLVSPSSVRVQAVAGESYCTGVLRVHRPTPSGASVEDFVVRGTSSILVDLDDVDSLCSTRVEALRPAQV